MTHWALARTALVLFLAPALATAGGSSPQAWGTTADSVVSIHATGFVLAISTVPASTEALYGDAGFRSCATGECFWAHPLQLPTGALITGAELSACDGDATEQVEWGVISQQKPDIDFDEVLVGPSTGATPGCQTFPVTLPVPAPVDNDTHSYILAVGAVPGTNLGFLSFRVRYRLQVSAAPAVATFADVPTNHPFFRFIEALAAAGVTGGCTPAPSPNYCPDAPITRGQMAVFLSVALGLHFPN
jgi:hypothetical protein